MTSPTVVSTVVRSGRSGISQLRTNGDEHDGRGDREDELQRVGEGVDEDVVLRGGQLADRGRVEPALRRRAGRQLAAQVAGEDRARAPRAERAADRAEQRRAGRRDPEHLVRHRVLDREHEHLHDHPEPEAQHQHVERGDAGAGRLVERGEQEHPERGHRRPAIGKSL
jgi:hypothetical protein